MRMLPPIPDEPVVFLGPSLTRAEARGLIRAEFRPPIRRGDLESVAPGRAVVILDGEFDQSFPVSPKEILGRLDAGEVVVGASSMGALRASELEAEGMVGIGRIFEAYRSGRIEGDDEVALSYCPISFRPRTVPLVHLRFWLERLEVEGWIGAAERSSTLRRARRVFYAERTPARLAALLEGSLGAGRLRLLRAAGSDALPDAKADDARAALSAVARSAGASPHSMTRSR